LSNARGLLTTTNADGTITKGSQYDNFIRDQGQSKLTNAEINNKKQSNFILSKASTQQELENLKQSSQYKSGLANNASGTTGGDGQGGGDQLTTQENLRGEVKDASDIRKTYPGKSGSPLSYPINRDPKQDYIKFTMLRYTARAVNTAAVGTADSVFGARAAGEVLGRVTLPIQPSISDTNQVVWGEDRMDAVGAVAQMAALQLISGESAEKVAGDVGGAAQENAGGLKAMVGFNLAKAAAGNQGGNLLTRATGGIINPNLELLFQGPALRSFTFNFSMSAREEREAQAIKQIIRFFKQGMSAKRASTSLFLMSPNIFQISYVYGGTNKEHPWINKIKECALQACTVDYTPAQNYATYEDGAMTQYNLSLTFGELDPIYDDDYAKADEAVGGGLDSSIGY